MKMIKKMTMMITVLFSLFILLGTTSASGATVTVTSPNGGETFIAGTPMAITWTSDATSNLRITLLKNGLQMLVIAAATPNDGNQNWAIPAGLITGGDYKVKIASCLDPTVNDVSDGDFSITGGSGSTMAVSSPNGGESFTAGTLNNITWTSDVTGNVRITLLKAGVHFSLISSSTPNDGAFEWFVPAGIAAGSEYSVKIASVTYPTLFDTSDAYFSIVAGGGTYVTVTAPNGGETFTAGTTNTITWTSDITGNVRISLLKAGAHYSLISSSTPNDGSFDWMIPSGLAAGTEYTVKIASSVTPLLFDVSDANFSVVAGGGTTVTVITPNGGESFAAGSTCPITWTSDVTGYLRISLQKNGVDYMLISAHTVNDGSFDWLIPATIASGTDYKVKICYCLNPVVGDVSDAAFAITGGSGSTVTVVSPNGGEAFTAGTTNPITWTSDVVGNVRITLLKAGLHYAIISSSTPNDGSYNWLIPSRLAAGTEYSVKIASATAPLLFDVSDAYFAVVPGGGSIVTIITPNGGETIVRGTTYDVTWTSDITGNVRITLLNGGLQVGLISACTPNDGSFAWLVPAGITAGTDYTVKIGSCLNTAVFDVSDASFAIAESDGRSAVSNLKTSTLESNNNAPVLSLYPNPVSEKLNIAANGNINHVWVLNSLGQTVFETTVNASDFQLDVNEFNPDMYFVRVEIEGTITTQKVLVK